MSLLAEVLLAAAAAVKSAGDRTGEHAGAAAKAASEAAGLFARLAMSDPVRANYYALRRAHVLGQLAPQL